MTNREAWRKGYEHGFKGLNSRPDYPLVGLAGSYRLGYEAGYKRRQEPKGPKQKRNPGFLSHAIAKHKVKEARKRVQAEIARVRNRITELEQEVIEYRHGPIWKGDTRAKQWAAQASLKVQKLRAIEKRLVKGLQELPVINPRRNGIIEAAAGLQALDYFGGKAKRAGLGRKPKFNPSDARFLLQIITASGKREQFTTNTEKQAREIAASWYSRGASVTVVDRKNKTQKVYGKKNPIASKVLYKVETLPSKTDPVSDRVYYGTSATEAYNKAKTVRGTVVVVYRKDYGKDWIEDAVYHNGRRKNAQENPNQYAVRWWKYPNLKPGERYFQSLIAAQKFADRKQNSVALVAVYRVSNGVFYKIMGDEPPKKNPRAKGSRDALGVFHAENPSETELDKIRSKPVENLTRREISLLSKQEQRWIYDYLSWQRKQKERQRKNPSITNLSRTFQGEVDGSIDQLYAADGAPANLARAGKLVFLKAAGRTFRLPGAMVSIAPNGKLWITGPGALFETKARKGEQLDVGEISHICYETAKAHIGNGRTFEFVHEFGEDGGKRPHLIIDHEGMPILRGGDYKIRAEGIVD